MSDPLTTYDKDQTPKSGFVKILSEPLSKYGLPSWLVYVLGAVGLIYLLNPTLGLLELIPDVLPFVGNLDEGMAVMLLLAGIVEVLESRKQRKAERSETLPKARENTEPSDQG